MSAATPFRGTLTNLAGKLALVTLWCTLAGCGRLGYSPSACDSEACSQSPPECDDSTPCPTDFQCSAGQCIGIDTDAPCLVNEECTEVCIEGRCSPPSDVGGACDEPPDCASSLVCEGMQCVEIVVGAPDASTAPLGASPLALFTVSPGAGTTSTTFEFDASGSVAPAGAVLSFAWDLDGDGTTDASGSPLLRSFPTAGTREVTLFATSSTGGTRTYAGVVHVASAEELITVDTASDVTDGGDGVISLREAIEIANAALGPNTISLPAAMTIEIGSMLPFVTDADTSIIGSDGVVIDCAAAGAEPCIDLAGARGLVAWVSMTNAVDAIEINGIDSTVRNVTVTNSSSFGIRVVGDNATIGPHVALGSCLTAVFSSGANLTVLFSQIFGSTDVAVDLRGDNVTFLGNLFYDNTSSVILANGIAGFKLSNNSIAFNAGVGVDFRNSMGIDARNNIVSHSSASNGFSAGGQAAFVTVDHNAYFNNAGADCNNCLPGPNALFADPAFANDVTRDLTLSESSPCVNAGTDIGFDLNGGLGGRFNGSAPDIGALESPF